MIAAIYARKSTEQTGISIPEDAGGLIPCRYPGCVALRPVDVPYTSLDLHLRREILAVHRSVRHLNALTFFYVLNPPLAGSVRVYIRSGGNIYYVILRIRNYLCF